MVSHPDVYSVAPMGMGRGNVAYFRLNKRVHTTPDYVGTHYPTTVLIRLHKPRNTGHDEDIELCFEGIALDAGVSLSEAEKLVSRMPRDVEGEDL